MVIRMKKVMKMILCSMLMLCTILASNRFIMAAPVTSASSAVVGIRSYEILEGSLNPGEEITLKVVLENNSKVNAAENVVLSYEVEGNKVFPIYGEDNQVYIGSIEAAGTKTVEMNLMVAKDYRADMVIMNIGMDYVSAGTIVTNDVTLNIPAYSLGKLVSESVVVASNATIGVSSLVSIRCKNEGTTDISDAKLIIDGNVEEESKEISLPILSAGKTCTQDYYVKFAESGIQTIQLAYQYTDNQGMMYTVDCGEYKVNVTNAVDATENGTVVVEMAKDGSSIMLQLMMLVGAAVAIVAVAVMYIKNR